MTYASRLRARKDPKHPCNRSFPGAPKLDPDTLDRMAEEQFNSKLLGGFSKKNICPGCFVARPSATRYCDNCGFAPTI